MNNVMYYTNNHKSRKAIEQLSVLYDLEECYRRSGERILKNERFLVWIKKKSIAIVVYSKDDLVINNIQNSAVWE